MTNYVDNEQRCQREFDRLLSEYGSVWHICTPGEFSFSVNVTEEDFRFSVSNVAISAAEAGLLVITDQVMANHIHVVGAGRKDQCTDFMDGYRYRQVKYLKEKGLYFKMDTFDCADPIQIDSIRMIRKEIVYCNRNGYLVDPSVTPFSYRWGGGSLYFNHFAQQDDGLPASKVSYRLKRELTYRSRFDMPAHYRYKDGMILPASYVDYRRGEAMFRNAHHYFSMLSKDYETFSEEAMRFGDKIVITDEEMYSVVMMMARQDYSVTSPALLPPAGKVEIARVLHQKYRATSQQIRRLLKLEKATVDKILGL